MIFVSGNFIAAGLSLAATFNELCYFLATHPDSQDTLFTELQQAGCAYPAVPAFHKLKDIPYWEGVVREAYRLHSSAPGALQRVTNPDGLVLSDGCSLPGSVYVGCPAGTINRDSTTFGLDADEYNPEGWMQRKNESTKSYYER